MKTKTSLIAEYLLDKIRSEHLSGGTKLPSQQQLMNNFKCSRTTVLRALDILKRDGLISGSRGSGTYIDSVEKNDRIKEIIAIKDSHTLYCEDFENAVNAQWKAQLPVCWVTADSAEKNADKLFRSGQAVIWIWPPLKYLHLMDYLKKRHIPQLLLNRDYQGFDHIVTDSKSSLREGLTWLLIESQRNIALVANSPSTKYPFVYDRLISFYECCFETNTLIPPENIYVDDFSDITVSMRNLGKQFFDRNDPPRGIFVVNWTLGLPVVLCASQYGLQLGRDYFLLTFDSIPELRKQKGVAEMLQEARPFRESIAQWLTAAGETEHPLFSQRIKARLVIH